MTIRQFIIKHKKSVLFSFIFLAFLLLLTNFILAFFLVYHNKIYPNIYIANLEVSDLTKLETENLLNKEFKLPEKITLNANFELASETVKAKLETFQTSELAYNYGRSGSLKEDLVNIFGLLFWPKEFDLIISIDDQLFNEYLDSLSSQLFAEPTRPFIESSQNQAIVHRGSSGKTIDKETVKKNVLLALLKKRAFPVEIQELVVDPSLSDTQMKEAQSRASKFLGKTLNLNFDKDSYPYSGSLLLAFVDPKGGFYEDIVDQEINALSQKLDKEPQNPSFTFENGKVTEFAPAINGVKIKKEELKAAILKSLYELEMGQEALVEIKIPVASTSPEFKTEDINDLGISELIGEGKSKFVGSTASRVYNIALASSKLNGILIKPGETFSFNKALGDISKFTGYKEAYVIKDGKTVLGDGGGVCQVSSTFFRAALDTGLPIIERRGHSYRVSYYEQDSQPGLDATVYSPTTDLKVKNDTPGHILIQAVVDTKNANLTFEFYGTNDGRSASTTKPVVTDVTPPPEDLYIDDPTLPAGELKQIDYKAWGAKTRFNYTVSRNNEVIYQKTFYTNYQPWQAKFLRGSRPAQ